MNRCCGPELETVVTRLANLVAKADGETTPVEVACLRSIQEELERHLRRMPQVASVYREPDTGDCEQYTLLLHDASDIDRAASNVAHCVQAAGARLYQLTPVARDLGSVFREANSSES